MSDTVIVRMSHVQKIHCSGGARRFAKTHNLDWDSFLRNGISSDELEPLNDFMVMQVIEIARKEVNNNG